MYFEGWCVSLSEFVLLGNILAKVSCKYWLEAFWEPGTRQETGPPKWIRKTHPNACSPWRHFPWLPSPSTPYSVVPLGPAFLKIIHQECRRAGGNGSMHGFSMYRWWPKAECTVWQHLTASRYCRSIPCDLGQTSSHLRASVSTFMKWSR